MTPTRHVVITAAGNSDRFARAGVTTPKWALTVDGKTLLHWSLHSIPDLLRTSETTLLVQRQHLELARELLRHAQAPGPCQIVASHPGPRRGQAFDAAHAVQARPELSELPLVIWNIDTALIDAPLPADQDGHWLHVAPLPGDHWSFADIDEQRRVLRTAEKDPISPWASTGLYGLTHGRTLVELVRKHQGDPGEIYVAPLYNDLIQRGEPVHAVTCPAQHIAALGTPEQMRATCSERNWTLPDALGPDSARTT